MTLMSLARYEQQLKWVALGLGILSTIAIIRDKHRVVRQMRAIIGEHGARLLPHSSHINAVSGV